VSGLIEREALLAQLADARREGGRLILVGARRGSSHRCDEARALYRRTGNRSRELERGVRVPHGTEAENPLRPQAIKNP
jgi:hypothetical protein